MRDNILDENLLILRRRLDRGSRGLLLGTTTTGSKVNTTKEGAQDAESELYRIDKN